jgi:hypothetical protein
MPLSDIGTDFLDCTNVQLFLLDGRMEKTTEVHEQEQCYCIVFILYIRKDSLKGHLKVQQLFYGVVNFLVLPLKQNCKRHAFFYMAPFKGTVRPDWICMRVVSLESPLKAHQPL